MPKKPQRSPDPLVMKVRRLLKKQQPRKLPTETMTNSWGFTGWKCPYCGQHCTRKDRMWYRRGTTQQVIDYGGYNMHFAAYHGTQFWKEEQLIKLIKRELEHGDDSRKQDVSKRALGKRV